MKWIKPLVFTVVTLALLAASQVSYASSKFHVGAFGSFGLGRLGGFGEADSYTLVGGMVFLTYDFSQHISFRGAAGLDQYYNVQGLDFFETDPTGAEVDDMTIGANLSVIYHFNPEGNINPYILGGVRILPSNPEFGAGVNFHFGEKWTVFGELATSSIWLDSKFEGRVGARFTL